MPFLTVHRWTTEWYKLSLHKDLNTHTKKQTKATFWVQALSRHQQHPLDRQSVKALLVCIICSFSHYCTKWKKTTNQSTLLRKAVSSQSLVANRINSTLYSARRANKARSCKFETIMFLYSKVKLSAESSENMLQYRIYYA